ncbi:MAG: SUMF1/EgtB/PvdO family nonheme iron enzyme, partial [Verrucomicrobiales bacterium]|nr:SUMF1/EgtB/PvdO family nonheme iron enzyme [Verrucomicrobiales bacterium]
MIPSLRASCLIALTLTLSPSQARPDTITPNLAHAVTSDDETLVARIRDFILKTTKERSADQMRPYKNTIPLTGAPYEMVNIPGGKFLMGSPSNEAHRQDDEGPQREIEIEPFWMGKFEVTWTMFEPFMITEVRRFNNGIPSSLSKTAVLPDFVSSPSPPYLEMDFGMGKDDGYPAISMTQHAASKFCQWLSAQTGHFYRLPTEAEWEYACRAGSKDAYYFGGDVAQLDQYAWYWHRQGPAQYAKVGLKKTNDWGLHDMLGNVSEWCLDQYQSDAYQRDPAFVPPVDLYPRVYRG